MTEVPEAPSAPRIPPCPDCGGRQVGGLKFASRGAGELALWWRTGLMGEITIVSPYVCLGCGRVKAYTKDLEKLRREVDAHPERYRF